MNEQITINKNRMNELKETARQIRLHILDMVYTAQSGHIGGSFSAAEIMSVLYFDLLNINPEDPDWPERDRFILSKGHACPVLYTCLAMRGYFPISTIKTLRQFGSILQGHPIIKTPGVDMSTGSLGLGFGAAVGMALEAKASKKQYSVFSLLGDGEVQEGVVWEAANTANKYALDNLVAIVDVNGIQNDGEVNKIMPIDPIDERFRAFGWEVNSIDGHNIEEVYKGLHAASDFKGKPYCIIAHTVKGKGVSFMQNDRYWHGKPPTEEQYEKAVKELEGEMV